MFRERMAQACPTCGVVHGDGLDCHGQPIKAVVVLRPGEKVRPVRKQPQRWVDYSVAALRQAFEQRQPFVSVRYYDRNGRCYVDWNEFRAAGVEASNG